MIEKSRAKFIRDAGFVTMALGALPARALAADGPIKLGSLTPLSGAGGSYGPTMRDAIAHVVEDVNQAGGIIGGRKLVLVSEDDQTNPEAGVRAARKLIDVDKVVAIIGTWASAVTTAVAPLCWESRTMLMSVSGADTISLLPHQGFFMRLQPNSILQMDRFGKFILGQGAKRIVFMGPQTPFYDSSVKKLKEETAGNAEVGDVKYDATKTSLRAEVDEALGRKPDMIVLGGYTPDTIVLVKDLYRAGYKGGRVGFAYAVNQKFLEAVPSEVSEGIFSLAPSPAVASVAYRNLTRRYGKEIDPYTCQCNDEASLAILAMADAKQASGTAIRDHIRNVSQGSGRMVEDVVSGLKLLAAGKAINFDGASGNCELNQIGDILSTRFRYEQIKNGKAELIRVA